MCIGTRDGCWMDLDEQMLNSIVIVCVSLLTELLPLSAMMPSPSSAKTSVAVTGVAATIPTNAQNASMCWCRPMLFVSDSSTTSTTNMTAVHPYTGSETQRHSKYLFAFCSVSLSFARSRCLSRSRVFVFVRNELGGMVEHVEQPLNTNSLSYIHVRVLSCMKADNVQQQ